MDEWERKAVRVKVTCTQLDDPREDEPRGVILIMEEIF